MIVAVTLIILVAYFILMKLLENYQATKLSKLLLNKDFDNFDKEINSQLTMFALKMFNIQYFRLNASLLKNNKNEIEKNFDLFDKIRMTPLQKEEVYKKAIIYYTEIKNKTKIEKYYELIKNTGNHELIESAEQYYDIYVRKGYKYLDKYLEYFENTEEESRTYIAYYISLMYRNKGDDEKADEYEQIAKENIEEFNRMNGN